MRIILADALQLIRDSISALLLGDDPTVEVVGASSLEQAISYLEANGQADLALVDLHVLGVHSVENGVKALLPFLRGGVVVISGRPSEAGAIAALEAGAMGFLPKTMSAVAFLAAVRLVVSGEPHFPAASFTFAAKASEGLREPFSRREREVLAALRTGASNKEIAARLQLEESTVKSHIRSLAAKLGARNRTDIVLRSDVGERR